MLQLSLDVCVCASRCSLNPSHFSAHLISLNFYSLKNVFMLSLFFTGGIATILQTLVAALTLFSPISQLETHKLLLDNLFFLMKKC